MSNYRRAKTIGGTYFFTLVTYRRRRILANEQCRKWLRDAIEKTRVNYPFSIDAWVLLPDHLHCVWTLPKEDDDFSIRWNLIKGRFSRSARDSLRLREWMTSSKIKHRESTIWQRRFWEHEINSERDYRRHVEYIHYNPVKHGLVKRVRDWPYSTFARYVANGIYPIDWGGDGRDFDECSFGE